MNLIDLSTNSSNKSDISLSPELNSVQDLLIATQYLYNKHEWQTHGSNDPTVNIKLIEAKADILRSINKLQQSIEMLRD